MQTYGLGFKGGKSGFELEKRARTYRSLEKSKGAVE
jgi:hypothetical protein